LILEKCIREIGLANLKAGIVWAILLKINYENYDGFYFKLVEFEEKE
jgi:hypothetical protein